MPNSAARPDPAIIEVGVARPRAHGQAITSTAIAFSSASANCPGAPQRYQTVKVSAAIATTIGTNIPEITSAIR
ncbi:hypothetical protein D3C73_1568030 [compost metagenome]